MRKIFAILLLFTLSYSTILAQSMSDEQVIQYVQQGQEEGKDQNTIAAELLQKGVTQSQLRRIQSNLRTSATASKSTTSTSRMRNGQISNVPVRSSGNDALSIAATMASQSSNENDIFGHDIFNNPDLSFEPNSNIATPENYRLGPGDEVIIDIWGASETTIRQEISPEGNITISGIGPVHLGGLTVKEANRQVGNSLSRIYAGINSEEGNTQSNLTLGDARSIQISIMGEVVLPGTYTLSSFSSIFHALYAAGGVNSIGSLRSVKVMRSGRQVADVDVYNYIIEGKTSSDIRLQENDVIIVSPYKTLVKVQGNVRRPMRYELKDGETISSVLEYAGGFNSSAYKKSIRLVRKSEQGLQVKTVDEIDYAVFKISDGDVITVDAALTKYDNRIEIYGAVNRPGTFQLDGSTNTIKQLIKKAEGLTGDAYLSRVIIERQNEDFSLEMIPMDMTEIVNGGGIVDVPLKNYDVIYIPSIYEMQERQTVSIHGQVARPGTFQWAQNMAAEDLVVLAGGLLENAATVRIEVVRRTKDPESTSYNQALTTSFSINLAPGLKPSNDSFILEPFDELYIRRSPAYHRPENVTISGEVIFSGSYAMQSRTERLSSLIERSGGLTGDAYVKGARLVRRYSTDEVRRLKDSALAEYHAQGNDSIQAEDITVDDTYTVGIDLEKALNKPGSEYDVILKEGDRVYIPEYISTVTISGAVRYPNTVIYQDKKSLSYYLKQAGGYSNNAKKKDVYVVHMNGTVDRLKGRSVKSIEPGSEIVVPEKDPEKKTTMQEILSIGTMVASLAAVVASIARLIK